MNGFWESRIEGQEITGKLEDAVLPEFETIPHGTTAFARIKSFKLISKQIAGNDVKFYEVVYKITDGPFKSREVSQKIKAFDEKPSICQRALNMLKLIYTIAKHIPKHSGVPTDMDHASLIGKGFGIKIGEWSMKRENPKPDQSMFMTGNNVLEVHEVGPNFVPEVGVKREMPKVTTVDIAPKYDDKDIPW